MSSSIGVLALVFATLPSELGSKASMELRPLERTEVPFPCTGRVYVTRYEGGCPLQFPLDEIVPEVEDAIQRGLQIDGDPQSPAELHEVLTSMSMEDRFSAFH